MRKYIILAVALLAVSFCRPSLAYDSGDFQYWNTESISYKIAKDWKLKLEQELRFSSDANGLYYEHTDLGVAYSGLAKWLDIGANYRLIFEEKSTAEKQDEWRYENRPHLHATLKLAYGNLKLSDRSRIEYRNKETKSKNTWRYRNKMTLKYIFKIKDFEIDPYIADEIFLDFDEEELNRNRLYSGVYFKLHKNFGVDLYYMWEANKKKNGWTGYNIFGTKLKLAF